MTLVVILNSGAPIILENVTKAQFSTDVEDAYLDNKPSVKTYTEQSMGDIQVNLLNVVHFREWV